MKGIRSIWPRMRPRHVVARLQSTYDLVLLDIWMPDTDGVTLPAEWSGSDLLTMPVIMMSGHATIETAGSHPHRGAVFSLKTHHLYRNCFPSLWSWGLRANQPEGPGAARCACRNRKANGFNGQGGS